MNTDLWIKNDKLLITDGQNKDQQVSFVEMLDDNTVLIKFPDRTTEKLPLTKLQLNTRPNDSPLFRKGKEQAEEFLKKTLERYLGTYIDYKNKKENLINELNRLTGFNSITIKNEPNLIKLWIGFDNQNGWEVELNCTDKTIDDYKIKQSSPPENIRVAWALKDAICQLK